MTDVLTDHIQRLSGFLRACGECIDDLRISRQGVPIHYNIDFSLLCPILFNFDHAPPGSKDFLISERASMRQVLSKGPNEGHYGLVVSGATIVEFFDQLDHGLRWIENRVPALHDKFRMKDVKDEALLRKSLTTSKEIKQELLLVTQVGLDERLRAPINRLLKLLDTNTIRGIGDVVDGNKVRSKTNRSLFDQFIVEQNARRHSDNRPLEDRLFHQRVDAINNCITLAVSEVPGIRAPFVTTTPLNIKQCTIGDKVFARLARTPLFLLNLYHLKMKHEIGDEIDFLTSAAREALELLMELQSHKNYSQVPEGAKVRLARLVGNAMAMLSKGSRDDNDHSEEKHIEEIMNNLSDQKRLQGIVNDALQDARDGAKLVELHSARFDLPYLDEFDFSSDPVIARIKKDLNINLKQ